MESNSIVTDVILLLLILLRLHVAVRGRRFLCVSPFVPCLKINIKFTCTCVQRVSVVLRHI
jgi:hypothetical protein